MTIPKQSAAIDPRHINNALSLKGYLHGLGRNCSVTLAL